MAKQTDLFLSHDWGEEDRNHNKVRVINEALNARGYTTWFDDQQVCRSIDVQMAEGIDNTNTVLVFLTQNYLCKVNSNNAQDNCRLEFLFAARAKSRARLVPVVMEEEMKQLSTWTGVFGMYCRGKKFIDMSGDVGNSGYLDQRLDELCAMLSMLGVKPSNSHVDDSDDDDQGTSRNVNHESITCNCNSSASNTSSDHTSEHHKRFYDWYYRYYNCHNNNSINCLPERDDSNVDSNRNSNSSSRSDSSCSSAGAGAGAGAGSTSISLCNCHSDIEDGTLSSVKEANNDLTTMPTIAEDFILIGTDYDGGSSTNEKTCEQVESSTSLTQGQSSSTSDTNTIEPHSDSNSLMDKNRVAGILPGLLDSIHSVSGMISLENVSGVLLGNVDTLYQGVRSDYISQAVINLIDTGMAAADQVTEYFYPAPEDENNEETSQNVMN